jgi:hypothetical protein
LLIHRSTIPMLLLAAVMLTSGCGDDDPVTPNPTPLIPVNEAFEGTLTPFSARNHPFDVQNPGTVTVTLTSITPDTTIVGLDLGTWTGTFCQINVSRPSAGMGATILGTATAAGALCVRIYDVEPDGLPASVTYVINVSHF